MRVTARARRMERMDFILNEKRMDGGEERKRDGKREKEKKVNR
jgi:hypothetical protein